MNMKSENRDKVIQSDEIIDYNMPIYLQLREIIRGKIEEGEYMPGTAIPSENKLADTFGINRLTVRNAVEALANEGILQRVQGKGVFVVGNKYEEALEEHGGFVSALSGHQRRESVKELAKGLRKAGDKFANYFDIEPEDQIFYVKHFSSIEDEPISIEEIYVPKEILPELEVVNTSVFTLKDIFAFYDIELDSMRQTLEVIDGMQKTRKMLNVPEGAALFMLASDYFDERGQSIGYSTSFVRSDKSSFSIKMH